MGKMLTKPKKTLKDCFPSKTGTSFTYKLFFMEGNIAPLEDAMEQNAQFVRLVIQIEKNQKKQINNS
tara:strand:- start:1094 stop:1294 length:201 start_codon:yes stop_codon:yes gene_type:complete